MGGGQAGCYSTRASSESVASGKPRLTLIFCSRPAVMNASSALLPNTILSKGGRQCSLSRKDCDLDEFAREASPIALIQVRVGEPDCISALHHWQFSRCVRSRIGLNIMRAPAKSRIVLLVGFGTWLPRAKDCLSVAAYGQTRTSSPLWGKEGKFDAVCHPSKDVGDAGSCQRVRPRARTRC
jgi:hypothetical protein